ncbi:DUF6297 family protein [Kineococcus esterisolvens]|uniref:DUF6297 family protein n=1 Tax=unclassified Kineococcus TaxID=2621656 RepID=UPI003D7ED4E4
MTAAPGSPLPGPAAGAPLPGRRELVREAAPTRSARGLRATLADAYTTLLQAGIAALLLLGASSSLRGALQRGLAAPGGGPGPAPAVPAVLTCAGLACCVLLLGLAALCRLGPVSLSAPRTAWWASLPVPREQLLRPVLRGRALLAAAVGALVVTWAASLALGVAGDLTAATLPALAGGAVLGAAGAAAGYALVAGPAVRGDVDGLLRTATGLDAAAAGVVLALAAGALAGVPVDAVPPSVLPVPAACAAVVAVVVLSTAGRRHLRAAGRTPSASLRRGAARLERLTASALQVDLREVGRALAADGPGRVRPGRRPPGARAPWVRGPVGAVLAADARLLRRQPRRVATAAVLALVPFVVAAGTSAHRGAVAVLLWAAGYAAATTLAEAVRGGALAPAAARALPVSAGRLLVVRWVPVAAASALWGSVAVPLAATTSGLVHAGTGTGWTSWALLGALTGPAWAAAAVRGALRPDPDHARPAIATPAGPVSPGAAAAVSTGPDLAAVATLPVLLALLARGAPGPALAGQLAVTALVVVVGWAYAAHRARRLS